MGRKQASKAATLPAPANPLAVLPAGSRPRPELPTAIRRMSHLLGSLQVAVVGLLLTILVLALGTLLESWYSAKIAQELVYSTWWFLGLMGLLAANIFFAAVKKWPWKPHQLGFLITHVGLLLLLAGGVLNALYGTDAMMAMVDTDELGTLRQIREEVGNVSNRTREIHFQQESLISVNKTQDPRKAVHYPVSAGSVAWGDTAYDTNTPAWVSLLEKIARPLPRGFRREIDKDVYLEVSAFYPTARQERFQAASTAEEGFPALKLQLLSSTFGSLPPFWLAVDPRHFSHATQRVGGGQFEFLGFCPEPLLDEFLKPPADDLRGAQGQVVVRLGNENLRLNVAEQMGKKNPLGGSGWQVQLNRYLPALRSREESSKPNDPAVELTLIPPTGKPIPYLLPARWLVDAGPMSEAGKPVSLPPNAPVLWYHPPSWTFGDGDLKGLVHFVVSGSGKVFHRSFSSKAGPIRLEHAGETTQDEEVGIWSGMEEMKFRFRLLNLLVNAKEEPHWIPVSTRPGLTRQNAAEPLHAVLRCELVAKRRDKAGKDHIFREPFLLRHDSRRQVTVRGEVDGRPFSETYTIGFSDRTAKLPFSLRLIRAEQQTDPGSDRPATYTSFVQVTDPDSHGDEDTTSRGATQPSVENHVITMNEPLDHGGFKFYQSSYQPLRLDEHGRPVSLSGLTVGRDPGLRLKYLGSIMLAVGIACMFYMRAYTVETMRRAFADRLGLGQTNREKTT